MPKASSCANPLFLRWVKEFHAEKDYRIRGGPPRATGYENAIRSLQECKEKYDHPLDMLRKVSYVGPTCIERLTEKLEEYCAQRGLPMPEPAPKPVRRRKAASKAKANENTDDAEAAPKKRGRPRKSKKAQDDDDNEYKG